MQLVPRHLPPCRCGPGHTCEGCRTLTEMEPQTARLTHGIRVFETPAGTVTLTVGLDGDVEVKVEPRTPGRPVTVNHAGPAGISITVTN